MVWLSERLVHFWQIALKHVWLLLFAGVFSTVAAAITWRDELLSPETAQKLRVLNMMPHWDWGWWVLISAAIVLIILIDGSYRVRTDLEKKLAAITAQTASEIQLSLDENSYIVPCFFFDGKPAQAALFIKVKNIGGHHLEQCQIQIGYDPQAGITMPEYAHFIVSEPFSMRPDEITTAHILYAELDPINDPEKHLCVPALTEASGKWERSQAAPILTSGRTYSITVEALSANTRKSVLKIVASQDRGKWVLRNAASNH